MEELTFKTAVLIFEVHGGHAIFTQRSLVHGEWQKKDFGMRNKGMDNSRQRNNGGKKIGRKKKTE